MNLKELSELKFQETKKRLPLVPAHAIPRKVYSDKTAGKLQIAITAYCGLRGIFCARTGNEGRYRPGKSYVDVIGRAHVMKGTWLPGQNNGQGDMQLVIGGRFISVEVKIGKDRQSEDQIAYQKTFRVRGTVLDSEVLGGFYGTPY